MKITTKLNNFFTQGSNLVFRKTTGVNEKGQKTFDYSKKIELSDISELVFENKKEELDKIYVSIKMESQELHKAFKTGNIWKNYSSNNSFLNRSSVYLNQLPLSKFIELLTQSGLTIVNGESLYNFIATKALLINLEGELIIATDGFNEESEKKFIETPQFSKRQFIKVRPTIFKEDFKLSLGVLGLNGTKVITGGKEGFKFTKGGKDSQLFKTFSKIEGKTDGSVKTISLDTFNSTITFPNHNMFLAKGNALNLENGSKVESVLRVSQIVNEENSTFLKGDKLKINLEKVHVEGSEMSYNKLVGTLVEGTIFRAVFIDKSIEISPDELLLLETDFLMIAGKDQDVALDYIRENVKDEKSITLLKSAADRGQRNLISAINLGTTLKTNDELNDHEFIKVEEPIMKLSNSVNGFKLDKKGEIEDTVVKKQFKLHITPLLAPRASHKSKEETLKDRNELVKAMIAKRVAAKTRKEVQTEVQPKESTPEVKTETASPVETKTKDDILAGFDL